MERDFLGLSSKASLVTVKEEACDGSKDSAALKSSGMQLSFSSEVSAIPQFLSFKASQEDRQREMAHDSVFSSGYMSMSTTDAFNCNQKPYAGMVQKTTVLDKQGGNHSVMKNYAMQHLNANQVQRPQEMRMFPISSKLNQTIVVSMTTPVLHSHLNSTGQSVDGNTINSQPHGGVSIKSPVSVLVPTSSIIGTTDIRNASEPKGAPAQLTIFYNGSVCVYDDVSPQKAQAIVLLAGNGSSLTDNKTLPAAQVQTCVLGPSVGDGYKGENSHITLPCPGLPGTISMTSHVSSESGGGPSYTKEITVVKPISVLSSKNQLEPAKSSGSVGSAATSLIQTVAVPQARKASLARFLEKRKERVLSMTPYNVNKKSSDCNSPGSEGLSLTVNSSGLCFLPTLD
ncbi:protein TIFY 6B isoform X2 [Mangifera indica]|uniref:protein TIFY 6B isoform X2 n=1 Tax=Mangifera indica TaxID=29780 RepID=UPI001CFC0EB0|nr:protein TIFY 6B isoform X2 [Mangifera indica]